VLRVVEGQQKQFTGFGLHLWPWPLVNLLLALASGSASGSPLLNIWGWRNVETWDLVRDQEGMLKRVVVHRRVRPLEQA